MPDRALLRATERALVTGPEQAFSEDELDGLDEPVHRCFRAAIEPGTPLWPSARITMRGSIRLARWLPLRAAEVLTPRRGFLRQARVAGVISGTSRLLTSDVTEPRGSPGSPRWDQTTCRFGGDTIKAMKCSAGLRPARRRCPGPRQRV
jgi:hypothetical protein